jgi:hypothetical protein
LWVFRVVTQIGFVLHCRNQVLLAKTENGFLTKIP